MVTKYQMLQMKVHENKNASSKMILPHALWTSFKMQNKARKKNHEV